MLAWKETRAFWRGSGKPYQVSLSQPQVLARSGIYSQTVEGQSTIPSPAYLPCLLIVPAKAIMLKLADQRICDSRHLLHWHTVFISITKYSKYCPFINRKVTLFASVFSAYTEETKEENSCTLKRNSCFLHALPLASRSRLHQSILCYSVHTRQKSKHLG